LLLLLVVAMATIGSHWQRPAFVLISAVYRKVVFLLGRSQSSVNPLSPAVAILWVHHSGLSSILCQTGLSRQL